MIMQVTPQTLTGTVAAIASKSDVHRQLICAALADAPTQITLSSFSVDINATIGCLTALGATIVQDENTITVTPIWGSLKQSPVLDCFESGSTLRFLLPVAAALGIDATLTGHGRLPQRPNTALTCQLEANGCIPHGEGLPLRLEGKLKGGKYMLPGNVSSQFVTGLLFALPLLEKDSQIMLSSPLESKGYVNMTLDTLGQFGIKITEEAERYIIKGGQRFTSPGKVCADGDWSNGAFWLSAGAIGGGITCTGLCSHSHQGDKEIIEVLRRFGAEITVLEDKIQVKGGSLRGITVDAAEIPDLIPIVTIVAAFAHGDTTISNAARLRIKESDRIHAMCHCITELGGRVTELADGMIIHGSGKLDGGSVNSFNDHRIAMSAAIAGTRCSNAVIIHQAEAVNKSYPTFFEHFKTLGGKCHVI